VLEQWPLVEAAIHETFRRDLSDPDTLRATTWRWFWSRVAYLLNSDNALADHFAAPPELPPAAPIDL
jgi:hypothetical protein